MGSEGDTRCGDIRSRPPRGSRITEKGIRMKSILMVLLLSAIAHAGTYTVKKNDTLGHIALRKLGRASLWTRIYMANPRIKNPNKIYVGMKLNIPDKAPEGKKMKVRVRLACPDCWRCGTNGKTATGANARLCNSVASVPWILPYGAWVKIPGWPWKVVNDTGGVTRREWREKGILQVEIYRNKPHWVNWAWGHKDVWADVKV